MSELDLVKSERLSRRYWSVSEAAQQLADMEQMCQIARERYASAEGDLAALMREEGLTRLVTNQETWMLTENGRLLRLERLKE